MRKHHDKVRIIQKKDEAEIKEDLFELCLEKGYIEKTPYGYYFTPDFYKTLDITEDD
jgi:hypothetical protein